MAASPLASTTFSAGAKDDVATADVYKLTTSTPINNIPTISATQGAAYVTIDGVKVYSDSSAAAASASGLLGSKSILNGIPTSLKDLAATAKGVISTVNTIKNVVNTAKAVVSGSGSITDRLANSLPGLSSALRTSGILSPELTSSVLSGMSAVTGDVRTANTLTATVNNLQSNINGVNPTSVSSITNILNSMTSKSGQISIFDTSALTGVATGVVNAASSIGFPGSYSIAVANYTSNQDILNGVASNSLSSVVKNSDLDSLSSMSSMTSAGTLTTANPSVLSDFSRSYVAPAETTYQDTLKNYNTIKTTYAAVDPSWNTAQRATSSGTDTVTSLVAVQNASPDFVKTLEVGIKSNPNATVQDQTLLMASSFNNSTTSAANTSTDVGNTPTVTNTIAAQYPATTLNSSNSKTAVSDPRVVAFSGKITNPRTAAQVKAEIDAIRKVWDDVIAKKVSPTTLLAYNLENQAYPLLKQATAAGDQAGIASANAMLAQAATYRAQASAIQAPIDALYQPKSDALYSEWSSILNGAGGGESFL